MRALALGLALTFAGCGPRAAWMADESERISASMRPERFRDDLPGAAGIILAATVPIARVESPRLEFGNSRPRRPGGSRSRLPPRARRTAGEPLAR